MMNNKMSEYIENRVIETAFLILETGFTVREAAKRMGVGKSTVHLDMTERLPKIDKELAEDVRKILDINKAERHSRGGKSNARKYKGGLN